MVAGCCRSNLFGDIVAEDVVQGSDVELSVDNGGVSPAGAFATAWNFELANDGVFGRVGFDESDFTILKLANQHVASSDHNGGAFAWATPFPKNLAGQKFCAKNLAFIVGVTIDMVAD
jgi:hypothetical protein